MQDIEKLKAMLQKVQDFLTQSQGQDLKSLMDSSAPKPPQEMDSMMGDDDDLDEMGKPKGISIQKVSVMGKPEMADETDEASDPSMEPSDEELDEMMAEMEKRKARV